MNEHEETRCYNDIVAENKRQAEEIIALRTTVANLRLAIRRSDEPGLKSANADRMRTYQTTGEAPVLTDEQANVLEQLAKGIMDDQDMSYQTDEFQEAFMQLWHTIDCGYIDVIGCDCGQDTIRSITDKGRAALEVWKAKRAE